jgi:phosphatidylglycerophosphatase A
VKSPRPLFSLAIATVLGVGYIPVAPGTCGSAVGLIIWWWALRPASVVVQGAVIVALLLAGSVSGSVVERHFGRTDPRQVVIDEVMGMFVTLFHYQVGWVGALLGFGLFRAADVLKPFPARHLERLPGGVGVMADDLMAAIYANLALGASMALAHWVMG